MSSDQYFHIKPDPIQKSLLFSLFKTHCLRELLDVRNELFTLFRSFRFQVVFLGKKCTEREYVLSIFQLFGRYNEDDTATGIYSKNVSAPISPSPCQAGWEAALTCGQAPGRGGAAASTAPTASAKPLLSTYTRHPEKWSLHSTVIQAVSSPVNAIISAIN